MVRAVFISPRGAQRAADRVQSANPAILSADLRRVQRRGAHLGWSVLVQWRHGVAEYMTEQQAEIFA